VALTVVIVIVVVVVVVGLRFADERWRLTLDEPFGDHLDQVDRRGGAVLGDAVVVDRAVIGHVYGVRELLAIDEDPIMGVDLQAVTGVLHAPHRTVIVAGRWDPLGDVVAAT
jgi:hypothetical protein